MISVVIPSYNRADRIRRSAESVLNQTYQEIELIIVDDGSSDNTEEVVKSLNDNRVRYVRQENQGACVARNTGISCSRGEYIAFQDSDDAWHADKLEKQLATLEKYHADVCFCRMQRFDYASEKDVFFPDLPEGIVAYESLLTESLVSTQTILAKRSVCEKYQFTAGLKARQDWDWIIRAAQDHVFCFDASVLVDVYLQNDSITSGQNHEKIIALLQRFYDVYQDRFEQYPAFQASLLEKIAFQKTIVSSAYAEEYEKKYKITKSKADLAKMILSRLHLLHMFYAVKLKKQ